MTISPMIHNPHSIQYYQCLDTSRSVKEAPSAKEMQRPPPLVWRFVLLYHVSTGQCFTQCFLLPNIPQLQNQSELRAPTPEKAAWFLDAAIAARHSSQRPNTTEEEHRNSHMLFTLHIYQYRMEKTGKGGSKCC